MLLRTGLRMLSPGGAGGRLSVLIFHRVTPQPDPLFPDEVDAARFDALLRWIGGWFRVLPLDEAVAALAERRLPPRALAISFDDGYADNHDVALPLLQRHGMPATFFIATGFLDGGRMWNDTVVEAVRAAPGDAIDLTPLGLDGVGRVELGSLAARRAAIARLLPAIKYLGHAHRLEVVGQLAAIAGAQLPQDLMMTSGQVRALRRAGMQIGAHTRSHPILAKLDAALARDEIAASRDALQALLDEPVTLFAYPNGKPGRDFSDETVGIVRELGFRAAVTTAAGAAGAGADLLRIPRFTPWDRTRWRFGLRLARNLQRAAR